jgi:hypothetical protein
MFLARYAAILLCAALSLRAAPKLTTIQDVIYKADGTRFNGLAVISWMPFDTSDNAKIGLQSLTVQIINGSFRVQLAPNTDATPINNYTVQYSSDGKEQFTETWAVPPSTTPLHIKDVRLAAALSGTTGGGVVQPPSENPINESNVIGLLTDLSLRPVRGSGYTTGRTAVVNDNGAIDSATGNLSDCVRVDGSSGPCFDSTMVPSYVDSETPGGAVDGVNASFTLANTPNPASSLCIYRNGLMLQAGGDYNVQSDGSLVFVSGAVPQSGDALTASYRTGGADAGALSAAGLATLKAAPVKPAVQILCSGAGAGTTNATYQSLASCTIPAKTLAPGDRVEVRFTYGHQGTGNGFNFMVRWGQATLVQRSTSSRDAMVTGHGDATIGSSGTNLDVQTWGTALPLDSRVASSADSLSADIDVDFRGAMSAAGTDTVWLQNYTLLRYPAH